MSFHINAKTNEIAETVLISGDPLRMKYMANVFLEEVLCFNETRGMFGYTGFYKGKRVSMLGTGMGISSTAIYVHELVKSYNVKNVIRVGTLGAIQSDLAIGDLVLAQSASSDSNVNRLFFEGLDFAPTANFELLQSAFKITQENKFNTIVGSIFSTDTFYGVDENRWEKWTAHGIVGVEMETSVLYTLAARFGIKALAILSVSDNIITGTSALPDVREKAFTNMFKVALETLEG